MTTAKAMAELRAKGNQKTAVIYAKHGQPAGRVLGVSTADMKSVAKTLKGQQAVALELYATGVLEAMYVAGLVANGEAMSGAELDAWATGASGMPMIESHTVPWVAVENEAGRALAKKWIGAKDGGVASAGWATYSGLVAVTADDGLDLPEIEGLLAKVVKAIHRSENRVRKAMNGFVISVGTYVKPLHGAAKKAAMAMGDVSVDVGDTACKVPVALEYLAKVEDMGRVGVKRNTIRC